MNSAVPVLETERTVMREWRDGDIDAVAQWFTDAEVMRFIGGTGDRTSAWRSMALHAGHWQLRGYGNWVLERRSDGAVIGRAGLWNPDGWPGIEVGWTLSRGVWGEGYATECGAAATAWAWENLPDLPRLLSVIDPRNGASRSVAERLGMAVVGDWHIELLGLDVLLYGVDRPA